MRKTCEVCGKEYNGYRSKRSFCSWKCQYKSVAVDNKREKQCVVCGSSFKAHKRTTCSLKCYYILNRDAFKKRYTENKDKHIEGLKRFKDRNPDYFKEYNKKYRAENKERLNAAARERSRKEENKVKKAIRSKEYKKNNPDKVAEQRHLRRARLWKANGSHTPKEWEDLKEKYGNICLCCREKKPLTVDHVIPLSKGGTNDIENIQPLCVSCNSRKGTKIIDYRF